MCSYPMVNKIAIEKVTRGTETSKYPEEEKETSIFWVAASETERAQTKSLLLGLRTVHKYFEILVEDNWKVAPQNVIVM